MRAFQVVLLAVCLIGAARAGTDTLSQFDSVISSLTSGVLSKIASDKTEALSSLASLKSIISTQVTTAATDLEGLASTLEAKFCTPASYSAGATVPATFTGPAFDLTFSTGDCEFDVATFKTTGKQVLRCTEPSITFEKTPASFVSSYTTGATFTSAYCNVTQTFGTASSRVLYTFDGSKQLPSVTELTTTVTDEVKDLLSNLTTKATAPLEALASLKSSLGESILEKFTGSTSSPSLTSASLDSTSSPSIYSQVGAILTQLGAATSENSSPSL